MRHGEGGLRDAHVGMHRAVIVPPFFLRGETLEGRAHALQSYLVQIKLENFLNRSRASGSTERQTTGATFVTAGKKQGDTQREKNEPTYVGRHLGFTQERNAPRSRCFSLFLKMSLTDKRDFGTSLLNSSTRRVGTHEARSTVTTLVTNHASRGNHLAS